MRFNCAGADFTKQKKNISESNGRENTARRNVPSAQKETKSEMTVIRDELPKIT